MVLSCLFGRSALPDKRHEQLLQANANVHLSRPANIWLFCEGSRGDIQPYVALALGLQRAGHTVTAFAMNAFENMFSCYKVPFVAVDKVWPSEEAYAWLGEQAQKEDGCESPDEFLFRLHFQKFEHKAWSDWTRCRLRKFDDKTQAEQRDKDYDALFFNAISRGKDIQKFADTRGLRMLELLVMQCLYFKKSVEEVGEHREKCCRAFFALLKRLSAESGRSLERTFDGIWHAFYERKQRVMLESMAKGVDFVDAIAEEYELFWAWQTGTGVSEWWERYHHKIPGWDLEKDTRPGGEMLFGGHPMCIHNIFQAFDQTLPKDRPQLIVHHFLFTGAALAVRRLRAVPTLLTFPLNPIDVEPDELGMFVMACKWDNACEEVLGIKPVTDVGVRGFTDMMRSPRQLIATTRLMLIEDKLPEFLKADQERLAIFKGLFTGPWTLDAGTQLTVDDPSVFGGAATKQALVDFLGNCSEPPVYVGWGSMDYPKGPKALTKLVVKALQLAGRRGVFVAGWSRAGVDALELCVEEGDPEAEGLLTYAKENVLFLKAAPHEWLFRQCACTVQHGGAGTLQAAMRAGVPVIITPVFGDQFPNGEWVKSLGNGTMLTKLHELSPEELADGLKAVLGDAEMKARAKEVADIMSKEPGVAGAVRFVEEELRNPGPAELPQQGFFGGLLDMGTLIMLAVKEKNKHKHRQR